MRFYPACHSDTAYKSSVSILASLYKCMPTSLVTKCDVANSDFRRLRAGSNELLKKQLMQMLLSPSYPWSLHGNSVKFMTTALRFFPTSRDFDSNNGPHLGIMIAS